MNNGYTPRVAVKVGMKLIIKKKSSNISIITLNANFFDITLNVDDVITVSAIDHCFLYIYVFHRRKERIFYIKTIHFTVMSRNSSLEKIFMNSFKSFFSILIHYNISSFRNSWKSFNIFSTLTFSLGGLNYLSLKN